MHKKTLSIFISALAAAAAFAGNSYFGGTSDKDALKYKVGEPMKFSITYYNDKGEVVEGQKLKWFCDGDDGKKSSGEAVSAKTPLVITTSASRPGFTHVVVTPVDDAGKQTVNSDKYEGGAGAEIEKLTQSAPEPEDFDEFWKKQLKALAQVPMNAKVKPVESKDPSLNVFELTLDCVGKPAKAYLTIPKNAAKKSLPIAMYVHGYGVGRIAPVYGKGVISLTVARHSYELGQNDEYYKQQKKLLEGFGMRAKDNASPEDNYFKFMILRDLRALQYAKSLPEWNGKTITVQGGSMGGFQSIFVAALDRSVTLCRPNVPWMCNLNGKAAGYLDARFRPEYLPTVNYFDSVNAIKRVRCPVEINARLGDYVCPPSGISILYNNCSAPVKLTFEQNGTHGYSSISKNTQVYKISK